MSRILYKYLNIKGAKSMIENQTLQFTNATQLNDPFDCHQKLIAYSRVSNSTRHGGILDWLAEKEELDAINSRNNTWICSLSKNNDSAVMWSHYCYNHTGICIGLDIDKVMECCPHLFSTIYDKPFEIEVNYQDLLEGPQANSSPEDIFYYRWKIKAKEWEHEQEVRLVAVKPYSMYAAFTPEQAKQAKRKRTWDYRKIHHYMRLRGECFDSIYFGYNIGEKDKEKIIRYARTKLNPQIKLYQMGVDDNALRLKPEVIEWNGPKKISMIQELKLMVKKLLAKCNIVILREC